MKKALHLLHSLKHGGAENVALNYSKVLKELGVESIFVGKPCSEEYEKQIRMVSSVEYSLTSKLIKDSDYIFVHTNINLIKLIFFFIIPIKVYNKRVIYIQHLNYPGWKFKMLSYFINFICKDFIQITPVTNKFVKKYIRIKVHFIVNFYINKYSDEVYEQINLAIREKNNIPKNKKVIMFSGVLRPGKRISIFIELAKRFQNDDNYIFLVIGDGPEAELIKSYKGTNLIWIGFVNDVEQYLIASDIYFFTSLIEMMPVALIEAINTRKSIIAFSTLVNNFLLNNTTFTNIDDIEKVIKTDKIPSGFAKYDFSYAKTVLSNCLNI